MAVFKCKMCGGKLETNNETVAVCQYCGTKQTLPKLDDDRKANLYDRANHFRRNNEFDKAMGIYEQILNEDSSDAEAYWSLVLCRYGIEYVEDPSTRKRLPTINRAQFTSVFDDEDYKSALQYADGYQKDVYEQEAAAINEIQKGILAISSQEEPFDVFICYKESDKNGRRTPDSVLATELYHELTREGFKVFFSRITLEDKLGTAYEPYIFAALNSSKVMVVLGTKPEYFGAVWVKNEWSRYLALIKNGARKILIPAYKDMDPYDLPDEFSHLQAQDMSKLGFMQDLIRGVKKIAEAGKTKQPVSETAATNDSPIANITALLKRGYMSLEDGEWNKANDFFEQALNQDAELAEAYLGKLMVELRIRAKENLKDCAEPFDSASNYQKALRFAEGTLRNELVGYIDHINIRNGIARKDAILENAKALMVGESIYNYERAAALFESILGWKDTDERAVECKRKIAELKAKEEAARLERERKAEIRRKENERKRKIITKIIKIAAPIVSLVIVLAVLLNQVIIPNSKYDNAMALMEAGEYSKAASAFEKLDGYKDSESKVVECNTILLDIKYKKAIASMDSGKYIEAYEAFIELDGYEDSAEKAESIYEKCKIQMLESAKVGDYLLFGSYEQDNEVDNGREPVEWLVLEKTDNKVLVISKYALDCQRYNSSLKNRTWESCSLRQWLNNNFFNIAFSDTEKTMIATTTVSADKNPDFDINPGKSTKDKVFLLSIKEANKYFDSAWGRQCHATEYAESQGLYVSNSNERCYWWLRSPGNSYNSAAVISDSGNTVNYGNPVSTLRGVRPAMWIDFSKID